MDVSAKGQDGGGKDMELSDSLSLCSSNDDELSPLSQKSSRLDLPPLPVSKLSTPRSEYVGISAALRFQHISPLFIQEKSVNIRETTQTIPASQRRTITHFVWQPVLAILGALGIIVWNARIFWSEGGASLIQTISFAVALPFIIPGLLGSMMYAVGGVLHCFLSVRPVVENSKYFSATPTRRDYSEPLPPVLIQMPVYLEDLNEVIIPTVRSAQEAMSHYENMGGSVRIFINDDGLQVMLERGMTSEFKARMKFYQNHRSICMVARPTGERRGYFKKASNMNYCLRVAQAVTQAVVMDGKTPVEARASVASQMPANKPYIAGGDLTMHPGTVILLIDSDTRMDATCISAAIPEFMADERLGYMQCCTTAFKEHRETYFQRLVWDFTYRIYHVAMAPDTARGNIPPLVGHNAFLSWRAIDACKKEDKFGTWWWSESHVSEDFDLAMRMMTSGFFGRYTTYCKGFEEGISLAFPEEQKKVTKFAYGAAEMLFNPLSRWLRSGPISPLFSSFWGCKEVHFASKLKMLLYLLEYFVIASSPIFVLAEVAVAVAFGPEYWADTLNYVRSYDITLILALIFDIIMPIGSTAYTLRARIKPASSIWREAWDNFKWLPLSTVQWTSYSFAFVGVITRYFFSLPIISWGSTAKEFDSDTFSDVELLAVVLPGFESQIMVGSMMYTLWASYSWLYSVPVSCGFGMYIVMLSYALAPFVLSPGIVRLRY